MIKCPKSWGSVFCINTYNYYYVRWCFSTLSCCAQFTSGHICVCVLWLNTMWLLWELSLWRVSSEPNMKWEEVNNHQFLQPPPLVCELLNRLWAISCTRAVWGPSYRQDATHDGLDSALLARLMFWTIAMVRHLTLHDLYIAIRRTDSKWSEKATLEDSTIVCNFLILSVVQSIIICTFCSFISNGYHVRGILL